MNVPDPEGLRCVDLAATHLNFRAAAAQAGLSPAAFSERIQRAEEELGVRLFDRTTRSVRLSSDGERLLPDIRACLAELRGLREKARRDGGPEPYTLTLGTRWELGLSWIVPGLEALRRTTPERTLHLLFGDSPDLLAGCRRGSPDAVVTSFRVTAPDLVGEALHDEPYVFVAAPDTLVRAPLRGPADARAHTLLDTLPDLPLFRYLLDAVGGDDPWPFGGTELLGAIGAVRARCLAGAGVAVLPRYFVTAELAGGALVEILPDVPIRPDTFRLWWRRGHPRGPALRRLAAELRARPLT